jgi:hypothetical protein
MLNEESMTTFTTYTLDERPDLIDASDKNASAGWPKFMLEDPVATKHFWRVYDTFPQFQVVLVDEADTVIACGNTIPITWDGTVEGLPDEGWDWALELAVNNHRAGIAPTTLSAIQVVINKQYLGTGLSTEVLKAMRAAAARHGLNALLAPVRPNLKHRYPLVPMERYVTWKSPDGLPFDPWLRTHARLGAETLKVCPLSMTITGTIAEWEQWTDMRFPESGAYIVPYALNPVEMDVESDVGCYIEPNVWMKHSI